MTEKRITLQCRMTADDLSIIDQVAQWHNIRDRTGIVRMLFKAEKRRIDREKARSEKIGKSEE